MDESSRLRLKANNHYQRGEFLQAIHTQIELVNLNRSKPSLLDHKTLGLMFYALGDFSASAKILSAACELWPDDIELLVNIGVTQRRLGRQSEAGGWFEKVLVLDRDNITAHDGLAGVYGDLGQLDKAISHGKHALVLKDQLATNTASGIKLSAYDHAPDKNGNNIIAYSLWGQKERYLTGAIKNVELCPFIYPGWTCRIYCDETVPEYIRGKLIALGAELVMMSRQTRSFEGLFWRFMVTSDTTVNRFLIRDADSIITTREYNAVSEWIESGKPFHVMRDWYTHTDTMLAGMWGGVAGLLPDLEPFWQDHLNSSYKNANSDQKFLREKVWGAIRGDCLIHDRLFRVLGSKPFPDNKGISGTTHIGQNYHATLRHQGHLTATKCTDDHTWQKRKQCIFTFSTGRSGTAYLTKLLKINLDNAEVHHERLGYSDNGRLTPDASHFTLFNSEGNINQIRQFWSEKLSAISYGTTPVYAEISHFLAKAGLFENIDQIAPDIDVDIVFLRRDPLELAWSFANRFDFANRGFTWMFYLDPDYPRNLVDPTPYEPYSAFGSCIWYVHEMQARGEYYKLLLNNRKNLHIHEYDLKEIITTQGAAHLLTVLKQQRSPADIKLPPKQNESKQWYFGEPEKNLLAEIIEKTQIDPKQCALDYLESGKRLG